MRRGLAIWCVMVLAVMTAVSAWASWDANVIVGFKRLMADRWGVATMADAYFGFTWFWLWICVREAGWARRVLWLLLLYALGNFAMAIYVLMALAALSPEGGVDELLLGVRR
jgi:hypothetical protein